MIPVIDRTAIYFISGIIAGVLESTGILDSAQHSANTDAIQAVAGPLIIIVSLALAYHDERHKRTLASGVPTTTTSLNAQPILTWLSKLGILKQTTTQLQTDPTTPQTTPVSGV